MFEASFELRGAGRRGMGEYVEDGDLPSSEYQNAENLITAQLEPVPVGPGAGHFAYHPDTLREIIKEWQDLADSYQADIRDSDGLAFIVPPGEDMPSNFFADVVRDSAQALRATLSAESDFCHRQAARFQAALDAYLGTEHATAGEFDKTDGGTVF
jgi:hypothetical protein